MASGREHSLKSSPLRLLWELMRGFRGRYAWAIVGPSGSGKTTIMSLLLRLYDYESGSIKLDGCELTELDRQWVRSQI